MNWVGVFIQAGIDSDDSVLNLGCCVMNDILDTFPDYPHTKLQCRLLVGVDYFKPYLEYLIEKIRGSDIHLVLADLTKLPLPFPDKSFDVGLMLDVLEHLPSLEAAEDLMREVERIVRKKIFIVIPKENPLVTYMPLNAEPVAPYESFGRMNPLQRHRFCVDKVWIEEQGFVIKSDKFFAYPKTISFRSRISIKKKHFFAVKELL